MVFRDFKKILHLSSGMVCLTLVACSSAKAPEAPVAAADTAVSKIIKPAGGPPESLYKAGKEFKLVRVMEGGACKNEQQGVRGLFLLYADPEDIERIKIKKGPDVFADFEQTITDFSVLALQATVDKFHFSAAYPDADKAAAQDGQIRQFKPLFQATITPKIMSFQKKTTLKIAVEPYVPELVFYQKGCEATKEALENEEESASSGSI